uniref:Uncharacterized protein n=1 Tax=Ditylum brightwellii TaxID=49249 RepID=A0A7S4V9W2_9STRA|mmetsp:Transcript_48263/g.72962  ORF Transcript_48263/g.72962 Transcript_48263/m.72962 type:complete len:143 (-) Transcript_48263:1737-2165(-)
MQKCAEGRKLWVFWKESQKWYTSTIKIKNPKSKVYAGSTHFPVRKRKTQRNLISIFISIILHGLCVANTNIYDQKGTLEFCNVDNSNKISDIYFPRKKLWDVEVHELPHTLHTRKQHCLYLSFSSNIFNCSQYNFFYVEDKL